MTINVTDKNLLLFGIGFVRILSEFTDMILFCLFPNYSHYCGMKTSLQDERNFDKGKNVLKLHQEYIILKTNVFSETLYIHYRKRTNTQLIRRRTPSVKNLCASQESYFYPIRQAISLSVISSL